VTWLWTVDGRRSSCAAICFSLRPKHSSHRTWRSRGGSFRMAGSCSSGDAIRSRHARIS
jgi:hypothetical protein